MGVVVVFGGFILLYALGLIICEFIGLSVLTDEEWKALMKKEF